MGFHADGLGVFVLDPYTTQNCCLGVSGHHDARRERPKDIYDAAACRAVAGASGAPADAAAAAAGHFVCTTQVWPARVPGLAAQSTERLRAAATPVFSLISPGLDPHASSECRAGKRPDWGLIFLGGHVLLFFGTRDMTVQEKWHESILLILGVLKIPLHYIPFLGERRSP